jgi:hypothetical protein
MTPRFVQVKQKRCYAVACQQIIPRHLLMCASHWAMVPQDLRAEVYATFRAMEAGDAVRPYVLVTTRAQLAVAQAEGQQPALLEALKAEILNLENRGKI